MMGSRRTQPHRRGQGALGQAVRAMQAGRAHGMPNPQDAGRALAKRRRKRRRPKVIPIRK